MPLMAHLIDDRPVTVLIPKDTEGPVTPVKKKASRSELEKLGSSFIDTMNQWCSPCETNHSIAHGIQMRQLATGVVLGAGMKASATNLRASMPAALLSRDAKAYKQVKENIETGLAKNPLGLFGSSERKGTIAKMKDEQIREILVKHCRQSRQASTTTKEFYRFEGTLAGVLRKCPELTSVYEASWIYKKVRIHYPRLGLGRGKKNRLLRRLPHIRLRRGAMDYQHHG